MRWYQRFFGRRLTEKHLDAELQFHLEQQIAEYVSAGMRPDEARRRARLEFGGLDQVKEECRDVGTAHFIEVLIQDLRYGLRMLRRNPGFTFVAVLTLALGIGINTTIFSVISLILFGKPPVKDPDSLCTISSRNLVKGDDLANVSGPDFESWQKQNDVFADMAAVEAGRSFTVTGTSEPESVYGDRVTQDYFRVVGAMPALGRAFLPSEAQSGNTHVVILSDAFWHERYGANPDAIGKNLEIDGELYTIVGVAPDRAGEALPWYAPRVWLPLVSGAPDSVPSARADRNLNLVLGRLKPGITVQQAQSAMNTIAQRLSMLYPQADKGWGITVLTLRGYNMRRSSDAVDAMMMLMVVVGLVLLIGCANIAGLLLVRGASRTHELAVRSAVGASRLRLLRQMLAESLLVGAAGGGAGLLTSVWGIHLLRAAFFADGLTTDRFGLDQPTLLFTLAVSLLATLVFGLLPALRASKANPRDALSESGRTGSHGFGRTRLRSVLVTGEIVLAVVLVAAASIITRDVVREMTEPNGFDPRHVLVVALNVGTPRYKNLEARVTFFQQVTEKVRNLPGVEAAGVDSCVPMGCSYSTAFSVVGQLAVPASERPSADFSTVGPDYFPAMQIPLLEGRVFADSDDAHAPVVAVVNQEFAQRFFPNEDAIGKQIEVNDGTHQPAQITGIVGNVKDYPGELVPPPQIFECYLQIRVNAFSSMALVVRSRLESAALAPMLRRAIWSVDKDEPVTLQTMQELVGSRMRGDKVLTELMAIFASLALLLATVGIYGVIAFSVAQRTREIGIRVALGAQGKDVLSLVLRQGAALAAAGCAIGALLALPLPHLFSSLFSGFAPQGPLTAIAATTIVAVVALCATYVPAYHATKVDPIVALRCE